MKRNEIPKIIENLNNVSDIKGVKFGFTILQNKKILQKQIDIDNEIINEIMKPTDNFKEFEQKRIDLCELYSKKDNDGNSIKKDNNYEIENEEEFNKYFDILKVDFKETLNERKKQLDELNELLEEEIEIEFKKINFENLPEELSAKQLEQLEFMIDM